MFVQEMLLILLQKGNFLWPNARPTEVVFDFALTLYVIKFAWM